ncbi:methionyl-tRNA formyltransferase [Candidatus Uhrbacteria bacterium RIFCSPHIGHO2_02_FULL_57_19]|uniref:Methionyl-tRNA formyltransferase n=1 Tax=Candidatus Uhrbacteria bacterium RIFCSPHIGHO2_02_FULL_57_19 TaxID=1802391 RepID=A0A1F7U203_9BACT|nr:MAG: methionyl-tRNA formyltransferase [Candidatus Uhrbacteria bacterium RIFCSPHIGHO2_02_FULL_57_19]
MTSDRKIRLAFWGTAPFAVPLLRSLALDASFDIVAVVTRPDEPVGREQTLTPPAVKSAAIELGLRVQQPESLKDETWAQSYAKLKLDVAVVVAYGKLIPQAILDVPKHQTLNVHPSLLPKYRGPSPIQAAITNGDPETGITIMLLDAEMDHGPLLAQKIVKMTGTETAPELEARLADVAALMLPETVAKYVAGETVLTDQNHSLATFTKIISREDGRVLWSKTAVEIERLHRAYQPWPGLWTEWEHGGKTMRIKPLEISVEPNISDSPGKVFANLVIACGSGGLKILRIQPEGKKEMSAEEFLRGHKDVIGSIVS